MLQFTLFLEISAEQLPFQFGRETFDMGEVTNDCGIGRIEDNKVARITRLMPVNLKIKMIFRGNFQGKFFENMKIKF